MPINQTHLEESCARPNRRVLRAVKLEPPLSKQRVVIVRCLTTVTQDTRLNNVAGTLAEAGADVTVLHMTRERELGDHVDGRGVRWLAVPDHDLMLSSGKPTKKERAAWRPIGANAGRQMKLSARRRRLHIMEIDARLTTPGLGLTEIARLKAIRHRVRLSGEFTRLQDGAMRRSRRYVNRFQDQLTIAAAWRKEVPNLYAYEQGLAGYLDSLEADVLHAHDLPALGLVVRAKYRAVARGSDPRVVFDAIEDWAGLPIHTTITPRYLAAMLQYEAEYIDDVDAVVTVSRTVALALMTRHPRLPTPVIVMNCPRLENQQPTHIRLREVIRVADHTPLMLYSGGINAARGVDVAIEALVHLPQWHLAIVAVPYPHSMTEQLVNHAEDLGVAERLSFAPPVPGIEILSYLSDADVGLIPISNEFANLRGAMPNKLFEYFHAGLPVVVSDCPEMAEFVEQHHTGSSFHYPDAEALASAVRATHSEHAEGISEAMRAELRELTTWESQQITLVTLYGTFRRMSA